MRRLVFGLAFAASIFASARARATAEFPQQIVTDLGITCSNPIFDGNGCTICHTSNNGGLGTATKPFGIWTKQNGLTPFNDQKLKALLQQLQNEQPHTTGTDCDSTAYVDLLTSCQWPELAAENCQTSGGDGGVSVAVFYGCDAAPEPALPASGALAVAGLLGAALVRARLRTRRAGRSPRSSPP